MHINPLALAVGNRNDVFSVGSSVDATEYGDFAAGKAGAARMFYDQSAETFKFYNAANQLMFTLATIAGGYGISIGGNAVYNQGIAFPNNYQIADTGRLELGYNGSFWLSMDSAGNLVYNDPGSSVDFRMEGDTEANLFFLDGSTDRIGIGTNSPNALFSTAEGAKTMFGNIDLGGTHNFWDETTGYVAVFQTSAAANGLAALTIHSNAVTGNYDGLKANVNTTGYGTFTLQQNGTGPGGFWIIAASTGDAIAYFTINGVTDWVFGIDNSDSDKFKLQAAAGLTTGILEITTAGVVVWNEAGADADFRIEGDTDANLFFLDASADKVAIGHNSPQSKVDIRGGDVRIGDSTSVPGTPTAGTRLLQYMAFW